MIRNLVEVYAKGQYYALVSIQEAIRLANGVLTLPNTETNKKTDKRWVVQNCVEVFILHRYRHKYRFPLGSALIYQYLCQSLSLYIVSLSGIVNTPLHWSQVMRRKNAIW